MARAAKKATGARSPLLVIFTTVAMDLIGFGMIVTLAGQYGKELGATPFQLGLLGASYSLFQFFFAPLWGRLSDRYGRRPILLMSLLGSTLSYLIFAGATAGHIFWLLLFARCFQGVFAANLSAAQAYIADITTPEKRMQGMGMIGAAFGVGFIIGPAIGGISANRLGLIWPGLIAAAICGLNFSLALWRLPESLPLSIQLANRKRAPRRYDPLNIAQVRRSWKHPFLWLLISMFFIQVFGFSNIEQTFGLFFQQKFNWATGYAAEQTGMLLLFVGFVSAVIQGGAIRKLAPLFGERKLLLIGLPLFAISILALPYGGSYGSYFLIMLPMALGRSLIDPSMSSMISKSASAADQGETFGLTQGLGSLARATGPFCGLFAFSYNAVLPFMIAGTLSLLVLLMGIYLYRISASGRFEQAKQKN